MPIINMVYKPKKPREREPSANTLAYYPLKTDWNEASWKSWYDIQGQTSISFSEWVANFYSSSAYFWTSIAWFKTMSLWVYKDSAGGAIIWWDGSVNYYIYIDADNFNGVNISANWNYTLWSIQSWQRRHLVIISNWYLKCYIDWQLTWTQNWANIGWSAKWLWNRDNRNSGRYKWKMSELIFEDRERTADEIQAYYNQTKANYWL